MDRRKEIRGDHVPPLRSKARPVRSGIHPAEEGPDGLPPIVPGADGEARPVGLECPRCGGRWFEVVYTRPVSGNRIQRRRECKHCGRRMTTVEKTV
jgi:hypothetical protein